MDQCETAIYGNEYSDIMVMFNGNLDALERMYPAECIQLISAQMAIIHQRRDQEVRMDIETYGYLAIPKCHGLLESSSMDATGVTRIRNQPYLDLTGRGVIVGIIGTGIDYRHPVFQNTDGTTRILRIWDQTIMDGTKPADMQYGSEYTAEEINRAIQTNDPSVVPSVDESGHGTFMAGIAAGSDDTVNDFIGAAPAADIVAVKVKKAKSYLKEFFLVPEDVDAYQENDIIMGVQYLFRVAQLEVKPLIIYIGMGTNQGDHAGVSFLENYLNSLGNLRGACVCLAAGNESNHGHHFQGLPRANEEYIDVEMRVGEGERGFSLELWTTVPSLYSVGFVSPLGEVIEKLMPRISGNRQIKFVLENTIIDVENRLLETRTGNQLIFMRFNNPTPGIWRIRVYPESDLSDTFHLWLPNRDFIMRNTHFLNPEVHITICAPGNASIPITAGAYNHTTGGLYLQSSRGYTRENVVKPDLCAPGVNVFGPAVGGEFEVRSGTSISGAHLAGAAALLMEWGILQGNDLMISTTEIKKIFIQGANRMDILYPNREWGYGTLDLYNSFVIMSTI